MAWHQHQLFCALTCTAWAAQLRQLKFLLYSPCAAHCTHAHPFALIFKADHVMLSAVLQRCVRALANCKDIGSLRYCNAAAVHCRTKFCSSRWQRRASLAAGPTSRQPSSGSAGHIAGCVKARHVPPLGTLCELHRVRQHHFLQAAHTGKLAH